MAEDYLDLGIESAETPRLTNPAMHIRTWGNTMYYVSTLCNMYRFCPVLAKCLISLSVYIIICINIKLWLLWQGQMSTKWS